MGVSFYVDDIVSLATVRLGAPHGWTEREFHIRATRSQRMISRSEADEPSETVLGLMQVGVLDRKLEKDYSKNIMPRMLTNDSHRTFN